MFKNIKQNNSQLKDIAYLLASQAISMVGTMLVQYAIIWHVTLFTQSGLMMGLVSCLGLLPMVLVMPFAGALVDRWDRKKIVMLSDGTIALVSLMVALFLLTKKDLENNMVLLLMVTFIRSVGQGFQTPAVSAIIPQLTPKKFLVQVNSVDQMIQAMMMLASPALAAALLKILPLSGILMLDFFTAALGIGFLSLKVKVPALKGTRSSSLKIVEDIKTGFTYLKVKKVLMALIIVGFVGGVLSTPAANLAPLQITRKFDAALWRLSFSEMGFALGMLTGGGIMSIWGGFKKPVKTVAFGYALLVLPCICLGLTHHYWLYFAMMVSIGLVVPISRTAMVSIFQKETEEAYMGRVMSLVTMAISVASPLTMLVIGPLADYVSIDGIFVGTGFLFILLVLWLLQGKVFQD